jgi:predicted GIY-YIG superfamily endonuclease
MQHWWVYIALLPDRRFYVGMTHHPPETRLSRHREGKGGQFTSRLTPVRILWKEPHATSRLAAIREKQLKGWSHAKKAALIAGDFERLKNLSRSRRR